MYASLLLDHEGSVATITLNRPEKRNALALDVMLELTAAFREVAASEALVCVLAANGPVFSAGHNFGDMHGASLEEIRHLFTVCTEMMDTMQSMPQPVIAKVHALATAAGCQLVSTCDLVVASSDAGFAIPGGKGGLFCHTPLVGVARNVGRKRALELAMTGDTIDAQTAAEWGLVNRVVAPEDLDSAVADLARRVSRGSAASKALGKQAYYHQIDLPQAEAYDYAIEVMSTSAMSTDAQEGIAAFLEKRKPVFSR